MLYLILTAIVGNSLGGLAATSPSVQNYRVGEAARPGLTVMHCNNTAWLGDPDAPDWTEPPQEHEEAAFEEPPLEEMHVGTAIPPAVPPVNGNTRAAAHPDSFLSTQGTTLFHPAERYDGSRPGYYFGTCSGKTGYYKDGIGRMRLALAELVVSKPPLRLPISIGEGLGLAEGGKADTHMGPGNGGDRPKTDHGNKTRRQKVAEVDKQLNRQDGGKSQENRHDAAGLLYGRGKTIAMADYSHVDEGCWAVDTINANCWNRTATYIRTTAAASVVAQETKTPSGPGKDQAERAMTTAKWKTAIGPCTTSTALCRSSGVAISCRSHIGMGSKDATDTVAENAALASRLQVNYIGAVFKGGFYLGSLSCHSCIGITAAPNLKLPGEVAATLRGIERPWILGCDANCTPQALAGTGWVELVGGVIHAPDQPTCNDNVYDFSSWHDAARTQLGGS